MATHNGVGGGSGGEGRRVRKKPVQTETQREKKRDREKTRNTAFHSFCGPVDYGTVRKHLWAKIWI